MVISWDMVGIQLSNFRILYVCVLVMNHMNGYGEKKHNIDTVWRFNQQYVGILHDRVRNPSINLLNEVIWFNKP